MLLFVFRNSSFSNRKMTLVFPETMQAKSNFRVPFTEITYDIERNSNQAIKMLLYKNDLSKDWGDALHELKLLVDREDVMTG